MKLQDSPYSGAALRVIFCICTITTTAFILSAQVSYPQSSYMKVNDTFIISQTTAPKEEIDLEATGADLVWDFSQFSAQLQLEQECLSPSQTGYEASFFISCLLEGYSTLECIGLFTIFTNQAFRSSGANQLGPFSASELVRFQRKRDNVLEETMAGLVVDLDTMENQFMIIYDIPDTVLHFPLEYEDSLSSNSRIDLDLSGLGVDVSVKSSQHRIYSVDGWGSVHTPYAEFENTLRVKMEIMRNDTLIINGLPTPIATTVTQYQWYSPDYGTPVFEVVEQEGLENMVIVNYIDTIQCFEPFASFNYSPQNIFIGQDGSASVTFFNNSTNADQLQWYFGDGAGSVVANPLHMYSEAGEYEVQLIACNNNCSPLLCDTSAVTITVQDTTSGIFSPPQAEPLDIFPNPANDRLFIRIPEYRGNLQVRIYNLQGRVVHDGIIQQRTVSLDIGNLVQGIYTVVALDAAGIHIARFVKSGNSR